MGSSVKKNSVVALACVLSCSACGGAAKTTPAGVSLPDQSADAPMFAFDSLDARPVTSTSLLGKPAVVAFITTYDPISQMQVSYLLRLADVPDVQVVVVALQDAAQRELVELYRDAMKIKFPVAIADAATIAGGGTLGDVHQVPTVIVLARDGHIAWKKSGGATDTELRKHIQ